MPAHRESLVVQFQGGAYFKDNPKPWESSCVLKKDWRLIDGKELYDIGNDLAQRKDVANQHPEIVAQLRSIYKPFWDSVSPRMIPV